VTAAPVAPFAAIVVLVTAVAVLSGAHLEATEEGSASSRGNEKRVVRGRRTVRLGVPLSMSVAYGTTLGCCEQSHCDWDGTGRDGVARCRHSVT
jgi:hypothetical protein